LETIIDEVGNVIIRKPAMPGMENRKGVILQAHLDMVNPDVIAKIQSVKDSLVAQGMSDDKISETIAAMQATGEIAPYNYTIPILMLVVLGVISVFLAYMLKKANIKQGYGLELPSGQKPEQVMEAETQANIE
jgi:hypothetical protein